MRRILDDGGLKDVIILVSGGINEDVLQAMMKASAPIDGFGIGVNLAASVDVPALDCAYKLQEYAGKPKRKLSEGKATWPGRKQVWRAYDTDGRMRGDILSLEDGQAAGRAFDRAGDARRQADRALADARANPRTRRQRSGAPAGAAAQIGNRLDYPVKVADALRALAAKDASARIARVTVKPSRGSLVCPPYSSRARLRRRSRGPCR